MLNKVISIFLSAIIVITPVSIYAQTTEDQGKIAGLEKGEAAPFSGVLLDVVAMAKIESDKKYSILQTELRLKEEFNQERIALEHKIKLLEIDNSSLKSKYDSMVEIKDDQIDYLNSVLEDEIAPDYTVAWAAGGVLVGILLSIGVFYAAVEIGR